MHFKGQKSSHGSRLGADLIYDFDTELMLRCNAAGLVTIGATTTPEMAFSASSEALQYGPTRNPWNLDHSVGGSSGGAGAAVGSGMGPIAHANDGGSSIRIPAACNGVVGMKPTRGRTATGPHGGLFLWGLAIEFAVTRSVRDSAALLDAIAGPDNGYFYGIEPPRRSFLAAAMTLPGALSVGVIDRMPGGRAIDPEIRARLNDTVKLLKSLGHRCETVRLKYDSDSFNESTVKLWAATVGAAMEAFSGMSGRPINAATTTLRLVLRAPQSDPVGAFPSVSVDQPAIGVAKLRAIHPRPAIAELLITLFERIGQAPFTERTSVFIGTAGVVAAGIVFCCEALKCASSLQFERQIDDAFVSREQIGIDQRQTICQLLDFRFEKLFRHRLHRKPELLRLLPGDRIPGHGQPLRPLWPDVVEPHVVRQRAEVACRWKTELRIVCTDHHVAEQGDVRSTRKTETMHLADARLVHVE